jgi:hypothetical protein
VKSYEAYLLRRVRGNVNNKPDKYNEAYFALFDRNEEEHTNVQRHLRGTKRRMAQILSDPIMRELQDKALDFHKKRVQVLRDSGEYDHWLTELKEASKIPLDGLDEVLFVQHLPKEWQEKVKELQAQGVPDKKIAKMIAQTQTAKKGETRQELLKAAGHNPEEKLDAHSLKGRGDGEAESLDNPFMNTEAAAGLGVPLAQERTQKIALAAQAAEKDDPRAADLLKKAEAAKKALAAQQARTEAKVDITDPAPPIETILDEATISASEGVQSAPGTVPPPPEVGAPFPDPAEAAAPTKKSKTTKSKAGTTKRKTTSRAKSTSSRTKSASKSAAKAKTTRSTRRKTTAKTKAKSTAAKT